MLAAQRGPHRRAVEVLTDDRGWVVTDEGLLTGDQLVKHRPERVEVRLRGHLLTQGLLRRHVAEGPDHHPVLREPAAALGNGEPKVADLRDTVGGQPDVAGLEVTVNDALLVGEREALADALRKLQRALERQRASGLLEQIFDVSPVHELANDEWLAVLFVSVEDRDDVRVRPQASHRLRLTRDALPPNVVEPLGLDERERNTNVERRVVGEVDTLLATLAEEALHDVAATCEGGRCLCLGAG